MWWNAFDELKYVLVMLLQILQDALFAAVAAIGFAAISNPPKKAYLLCAIIAAAGQSARYLLMNSSLFDIHIVAASTIAAFIVGTLAVLLSPYGKMPAETCLFPSLLPMIPGIYAYKAFGSLMLCLSHGVEAEFNHYFFLFASNGITCLFILLGMVVGGTLPIFFFKNISFQATR
ncbi:MAG: threonine/serine exporter family protein [Muribaculaceae bacterium]|nr:threonine/serine exporter family protein [Muribaculaceae bacterium]